jgi:hypothetical protein
MKFSGRLVIILLFIISLIFFTIGYTSLPILKSSKHVLTTNVDMKVSTQYYINRMKAVTFDNITKDSKTIETKYSTLGGKREDIFNAIMYTSIGATIMGAAGIILSIIGLKMISTLLLAPSALAMFIIFSLCLILITDNLISSELKSSFELGLGVDASKTLDYDSGFILISIGACAMVLCVAYYRFFL